MKKKKILDFLKGHYNQEFGVGNRSKTETKRLSEAKNDIISKMTNSMQGFMLLSEIIRISNITSDKISEMPKILDFIFAFHPQCILSQNTGGHIIYRNAEDIADARYKDSHKKYYRDMAGILVESGINEIKKNLHPDKDMALMSNLDLTVNMIKRLTIMWMM